METQKKETGEICKILLLGTFHFADPNLDVVKLRSIDVLRPESQDYLDLLARRLAEFRPSVVLLEYSSERDQEVNERFLRYRQGSMPLAVSEIEQIGFRVAAAADLAQVYGVDEKTIFWRGEELFLQLKEEPEVAQGFFLATEQMAAREKTAHQSLTLQELLRRSNSRELDEENKSLYLRTNSVGVMENFAGADAAASWWHRNFRIFARIQAMAKPGARLLVIAGQGHTAILRDFVKLDPRLVEEQVSAYI